MLSLIATLTATQEGLWFSQLISLKWVLTTNAVTEVNHGDCVGGDAEGHLVAHAAGCLTNCYPSTLKHKRAWTAGHAYVHEPLPPLVRNRLMVDRGSMLIATPSGPERLRSGTWATVRYARKLQLPVDVIRPDGLIEMYRYTNGVYQASLIAGPGSTCG